MPIKCSKGKVRYRWRSTSRGKQRLALCGKKVVEVKQGKHGAAKKVK
jgi:hypothetical protein